MYGKSLVLKLKKVEAREKFRLQFQLLNNTQRFGIFSHVLGIR